MSNKKTSFGKVYLISALLLSLVTFLFIILGARIFWTRNDTEKFDKAMDKFVEKTYPFLSDNTDPEAKEKLAGFVKGFNDAVDSFSANVKLPDGSFLVDLSAEESENVNKAINDLPGLIGSEDLLGYTKYRARVKTLESPALKGEATVVIVFKDNCYQIYREAPIIIFIAIGISLGSGFLFGLIPAFISRKKSLKRTDSLSGYSLG